MALTVLIVSPFALLALKMPIGMALAVSSTAYLLTSERSFPFNIMVERMISGLDSYPFLAVPFFIMAARFMNSAGITQRIFDSALSIVGHIRGGLGHVNIMIGMLTPPLGVCLYIAADIAEAPFERVIRAVLPFYVPLFITLLLITYFPGWVMFLPDLLLPNP